MALAAALACSGLIWLTVYPWTVKTALTLLLLAVVLALTDRRAGR